MENGFMTESFFGRFQSQLGTLSCHARELEFLQHGVQFTVTVTHEHTPSMSATDHTGPDGQAREPELACVERRSDHVWYQRLGPVLSLLSTAGRFPPHFPRSLLLRARS